GRVLVRPRRVLSLPAGLIRGGTPHPPAPAGGGPGTIHRLVADPRRRRILRFFGPRGDLLAAEVPGIAVYDATGEVRFRTELDGFLDIAPVGDELWAIAPGRLVRLSARD